MPSQLTKLNLFEAVYNATSEGVKSKGYAKLDPWIVLIPKLGTLCDTTFEATHASSLEDLRNATKTHSGKAGSYGAFLLSSSGLSATSTTAPTEEQTKRIAALELLSHTYFHSTKGKEAVWIVSVPKHYTAWPHVELANKPIGTILATLDIGGDEKFSFADRRHIATAAQTGLAWTQKALIALDNVKSGSSTMEKLKRWFGNGSTTEVELTNFADTLRPALRKIAVKLNGGTVIVTDLVAIRTSANVNDIKARRSNAFVAKAEKQDVIYIEEGFFTPSARNVFQSSAGHWARIMVHEMTHREGGTVDKRYGWAGIGPSTGKISPTDAMVNADSWAIFVADAAEAMSKTDIERATNGV